MLWNRWLILRQVSNINSFSTFTNLIIFNSAMMDTYAEPDCAMEAAMVKVESIPAPAIGFLDKAIVFRSSARRTFGTVPVNAFKF